jgi:hypothetical protein
MKHFLIITVFICLFIFGSRPGYSQAVVVNEYFNGFSQNAEYIELLVISNNTDMRSYMVRDYSSSGNPQASLRFSNNSYWANMRAGTLIAITGDTSAYIQDTSRSDFSILIRKGSDQTYITGNMFNIATESDAVQILRVSDSSHVHGISHGSANFSSLPSPKGSVSYSLGGGILSLPLQGAALEFTKLTTMSLSDFGNGANLQKDSLTQSPAQPNDAAGNLLYINALRTNTGVINITTQPAAFDLAQNYPNPFNPSTTIKFSIPSSGYVSLKVFNTSGEEINALVNNRLQSGIYETSFDGRNLASGIYFYTLSFNGSDGNSFTDTKKLMLVK